MQKIIWLLDNDQSLLATLISEAKTHSKEYFFEIIPNGTELISKLFSIKPDAICIDPDLNEIDGIQLIKSVRFNPETSNIIFIIMDSEIRIDERAREANAHDFIRKPFTVKQFIEKIDEHLK